MLIKFSQNHLMCNFLRSNNNDDRNKHGRRLTNNTLQLLNELIQTSKFLSILALIEVQIFLGFLSLWTWLA